MFWYTAEVLSKTQQSDKSWEPEMRSYFAFRDPAFLSGYALLVRTKAELKRLTMQDRTLAVLRLTGKIHRSQKNITTEASFIETWKRGGVQHG